VPRPQLKPTDEHRRLVKSMAALGTPQEHIARKIKIRSPKTLRKYFRDELDFGMTEANYKVAQTLFQMATSGKCYAATQFWMKTRARFRENSPEGVRPAAPPPFVVANDPGGFLHG
jgi:hypothetical protein